MLKLVIAVLLVGCGSKKLERDCDGYAQQVADLSDPAPGRRDQTVAISTDLCARGRIPDEEMSCVMRARTRDALIECTTGRPAVHAEPKPPTSIADAASGTNAVTLTRIENGQGFRPLDPGGNEDHRAWVEEVKRDIAACASDEIRVPQEYVLVMTFGGGPPVISPGGLPSPLSFCVKGALTRRLPLSVGNGPVLVHVDVGR